MRTPPTVERARPARQNNPPPAFPYRDDGAPRGPALPSREYGRDHDHVEEMPTWNSWEDDEEGYRESDDYLSPPRGGRRQATYDERDDAWPGGPGRQSGGGSDGDYWEPPHAGRRRSYEPQVGNFLGRWATTFTQAVRDIRDSAPYLVDPAYAGKHRRLRFLNTRRGRMIAAVVCAVMLVCSLSTLGTSVLAFAQYQHILTEAKAGVTQLDAAKTSFKAIASDPFSSQAITQAYTALAASHADFVQVNNDLGRFPGFLTSTPAVGAKLNAAQRIVPIAVEATQAGMIATNMLGILSARLKNPLDATGSGVTTADIATINTDFAQVDTLFQSIVRQVQTLPPDAASLDSRLGPLLTGMQQNLPKIIQGEQDAKAIVGALPLLLGVGKPATYMLQVLDSTELRPGGGFIGNFGSLTLSGGRIPNKSIHIEDVDLLDNAEKYQHVLVMPIPAQYSWFTTGGKRSWSFRDSNLEADFPTSAHWGEVLYTKEGGTLPFQGVIAITPWLIQDALKLTGPITLTEYQPAVVVTAANLIDQIHAHQLSAGSGPDNQYDPACGSSYRKCFTSFLFQGFLAQAKQAMAKNFSQFAHLFTDGFRSKDLQVYINQPSVEAALTRYHLASAVEAPAQGDSLFIADANIGANKANNQLQYTVRDQVTLDTSGTATHHLVMTYVWPDTSYNRQNLFPNPANTFFYQDYLQVYVPPGATLKAQSGWDAQSTITAFGRKVFTGFLYFYIGQTATISLTWSVPNAATHDASGWHYTDLVQKQAGVSKLYDVEATLPGCASVFGTLQGFITPSTHLATYKMPLPSDESLAVNYTC